MRKGFTLIEAIIVFLIVFVAVMVVLGIKSEYDLNHPKAELKAVVTSKFVAGTTYTANIETAPQDTRSVNTVKVHDQLVVGHWYKFKLVGGNVEEAVPVEKGSQ